MSYFDQTFNRVYSIGKSCVVAEQLKYSGLKIISGPFDWILTDDLSIITDNLKSRFKEIFLPINMVLNKEQTDSEVWRFTDNYSDFESLHDVIKNSKIEDSLFILKCKFDKKVDCFFNDLESRKPILLVRYLNENDDLLNLDLKLQECSIHNYKILGIMHSDDKEIRINAINERVIMAEINAKSTYPTANGGWIGNIFSWQTLLSKIEVISRNTGYHANFNNFKKNVSERQTVIWGVGAGHMYIKYLLESESLIDYKIYDTNVSNILNLPMVERYNTINSLSELNPVEHYIIVSTKKYYPEIVQTLINRGFIIKKDFIIFYQT